MPIVYQVDEATKDRWIKFQLALGRGMYVAIAAYVFVITERRWQWWLILTSLLMYVALYLGIEVVILSRGQRAATNRWQGPLPVFSGPAKRYLVLSLVSAVLAVLVFLDA